VQVFGRPRDAAEPRDGDEGQKLTEVGIHKRII
jgi:hypothetical protein